MPTLANITSAHPIMCEAQASDASATFPIPARLLLHPPSQRPLEYAGSKVKLDREVHGIFVSDICSQYYSITSHVWRCQFYITVRSCRDFCNSRHSILSLCTHHVPEVVQATRTITNYLD
ncbi:hypothetical protein VPH35_089921 [Triticum aestivum]|uniref:uncharacterized protein n=1 Tax=Triticum aestivum TaxID=4565 RepID=UPI001D0027ED|nr:uncharacterized protein LOC123111768 [Triticum aestivum]